MSATKDTVLYDSDCSLCTFQMKVITWLDWFHRIVLLPIADPRAAQLAPGIDQVDLQEAIHCITAAGKIHRGARCIRYISWKLPLAIPVALFLWIPGVIYIAEIAYRWLSRNRLLLSKVFGCKGACAILPTRAGREVPPAE